MSEQPGGHLPEREVGEVIPGPLPAADPSLRGQAVLSVRWNLVAATGKQGLRLVFLTLVARIIGPHDFGIAGQAFIYIAFISVLRSEGFGSALIRKPTLGKHDRGSATLLNLALAGALIIVTIAFAPAYASFFRTPKLTPVLRVLTLSVLFQTLAMVPQALLMRDLHFKPIAVGEVASTFVGTVAGLAAAFAGASYWSVVVQQVTMDVVLVLVLTAVAGLPTFRVSASALREIWRFGSRVLGNQLTSYTISNADYIIVGRFLGTKPLGFYSLSYRTMMLPVANLGIVVNRVAFPIYSKIQDDRPRMARQFLLASRLIALLAFPLMTLVAVAAPLGVPLVFGPEWQPAVLPMQLLSLSGAVRAVQTMVGPVMLACGRADWTFRFGVISGVVYVGGFFAGLPWGIEGVAAAYSVALLLVQPVAVHFVGRLTGLRVTEFFRTLAPVILGSAAMAATWIGVALLTGDRIPDAAVLVVASLAAGTVYVASLSRFPAVTTDVRRLLDRRADAAAE